MATPPPDFEKVDYTNGPMNYVFLPHGSLLNNKITRTCEAMSQNQQHSQCAQFERRMMGCIEYAGYGRYQYYCRNEMEDFQECVYGRKQQARVLAMSKVLRKKVKAGEMSYKDLPPNSALKK